MKLKPQSFTKDNHTHAWVTDADTVLCELCGLLQSTIEEEKAQSDNKKIGAKVHVYLRKYGKVFAEWNGVIIADCSYFGDSKRTIWGVDRVESLEDFVKLNRGGYICVDDEDLVTRRLGGIV